MSSPVPFALDEARWAQAREQLVQGGRVHIGGALDERFALALRDAVAAAPWSLALNTGAQGREFLPEHIARLDPGQATRLGQVVQSGAERGFQYLSDSYRISTLYDEGHVREGLLADLYEAFNSPAMLARWRDLTGDAAICYADMQATRYRPGHFLTTHDDDLPEKGRRYAYVLNLTQGWNPDWGGLLLFHGPGGHIAEGYAPAWNALNVFRVKQPHAVSLVAPFAAVDRLSITGWLRTIPDPRSPFGGDS